jgi:peptide-methionine (S)-S-oxide reductase
MSWEKKSIGIVILVVLAFGIGLNLIDAGAAEKAVIVPAPVLDNAKAAGPLQTAVLAGGCFWGVQAVYQHVNGVRKSVSGYAGGDKASAHYDIVSSGQTGHAESVQVTFDPKEVTYGQILQVYFSVAHDPTQLNRQEPDTGPQYRSNIFYSDETQKKIAEAYIAQLNKAKVYPKTIATRVDALKVFYAAEDYHQDFLFLNPTQPYIARYDMPKLDNLKAVFPVLYRKEPVLVKSSK